MLVKGQFTAWRSGKGIYLDLINKWECFSPVTLLTDVYCFYIVVLLLIDTTSGIGFVDTKPINSYKLYFFVRSLIDISF